MEGGGGAKMVLGWGMTKGLNFFCEMCVYKQCLCVCMCIVGME